METGLTDGCIFGKAGGDVFCCRGAKDHIRIGAGGKFQIGSIAPDGIFPIFSWENPQRIPNPEFGHVAIHKVIEGKGVCGDKGKAGECCTAFQVYFFGAAGFAGKKRSYQKKKEGCLSKLMVSHTSLWIKKRNIHSKHVF